MTDSSTEKTLLLQNETLDPSALGAAKESKKDAIYLNASGKQMESITTLEGQHIMTNKQDSFYQWSPPSLSLDGEDYSYGDTLKLPPEESHHLPKNSDVVKGILLAIIGAGTMYGLTGVFVRLAREDGIESAEILFVRSLVQIIVFGFLLVYKKESIRPPEGKNGICVLIAFVYSVATISSFEAFGVIPPGNAIATRGASRTVFAFILSFLLSNEKISWKDFVMVMTCVTGIAAIIASSLISDSKDYIVPTGMGDDKVLVNVFGYTLIVLAGITRSLGMINVRKIKDEIHSFTIVLYHSSLTFVFSLLFVLARSSSWSSSPAGSCWMLAVCVTSSIATWSSNHGVIESLNPEIRSLSPNASDKLLLDNSCRASAVKLIHPALVSMGQNADLVVSIILEHTLLGIFPQVLELLGAGIVLLGVCGMSWFKWKESKAGNS